MSLLFIIFGIKTREKDHGPAYPATCTRCANEEYMHIFRDRSWFHIFWIPLIPWFAKRWLVCPICGQSARLSRSQYKDGKQLASTLKAVQQGTAEPDRYWNKLEQFEETFVDENDDIEPKLDQSEAFPTTDADQPKGLE